MGKEYRVQRKTILFNFGSFQILSGGFCFTEKHCKEERKGQSTNFAGNVQKQCNFTYT